MLNDDSLERKHASNEEGLLYLLPFTLLLNILLSIFPRPATATSTRQGTPPPMVTVARIADLGITHVTEYLGHVEDF